MRDVLVTAIVLVALVYAFRRPWLGVMLWTWLSIMNPHRMTWGFAYDMPFAAMTAGVTLLAMLTTKETVRLPSHGAVRVLVLFIVWMGVTTAFAYNVDRSFDQLTKIAKIQLMTLVALAVLHDKRHILIFVWVNTLSLAFFGFKGGLYTIATAGGGRVWGPGGFIGGNNEIGLAMLMVIPFLYFLFLQLRRQWQRALIAATMLLTTVAVLGTQSRGAFLAILAMAGVLWWRAPKKLLLGALIAAAAVIGGAVMSAEYAERIASIENYEEDSSAVGRLYAWRTAINIANRRATGAGFAMYDQRIVDRYAAGQDYTGKIDEKILQARAAHSIYFQVLGEHGWIGLVLYVGVFALTWRGASRLRRRARGDPDLLWVRQLASMCHVSLAAYAVGGAFLSLAYFDLPYNIMIIVVVTERWLAHRSARSRAAAEPAATSPTATPKPAATPLGAGPTAASRGALPTAPAWSSSPQTGTPRP